MEGSAEAPADVLEDDAAAAAGSSLDVVPELEPEEDDPVGLCDMVTASWLRQDQSLVNFTFQNSKIFQQLSFLSGNFFSASLCFVSNNVDRFQDRAIILQRK